MTDNPDKAGKPLKAALILFALLLGACAKQLTTDERLVMITRSSPTPTPAATQPQTITGKVVGVSDGDTITVLDASNKQHKIRLEGIDAPESNQDFGSRAKQSLSDLVFGKTVTVTSRKKDMYGCVLGKVTLDGKDINKEQINRGMAWFNWPYESELPDNVAVPYKLTYMMAHQKKLGLWADASPIPPWDFRRGKTAKAPGVTPPAVGGQIIGNRNRTDEMAGFVVGFAVVFALTVVVVIVIVRHAKNRRKGPKQ
jgi:endonuclease YncB( thermonuclease family)